MENNNNNNNNNRQSYDMANHDVASTWRQRSHDMASTSTQRSPYPPGYRFIPTDEELIIEYLLKKVNNKPIPVAEMSEVNLYIYTPHYLAENYPQLGDKEWYFFTPRDRKYPNGKRPKRSVEGIGYWKATGVDKSIWSNGDQLIGKKKVLVFYFGKSNSDDKEKTNWIMHEYKLNTPSRSPSSNNMRLDDWVLCRIYEKPERSNKERNDVDDRVAAGHDEDHDNLLSQLSENNNIEDPAALNNHDRGLVMMINGHGDHHHHQFPANYQEGGFNQVLDPNYLMPEAAGPWHDMDNFYGQNNFDYGMFYDQQYISNEQQAFWDSHHQGDHLQQDFYWTMGNNGYSFHQDPLNINSNISVDDYLKVDGSSNDGATRNTHGEQLGPKRTRYSEG